MSDRSTQRRNLPLNVVYTSLSWGIPLLIGFLATPVLVNGLGLENYGALSLVLLVLNFGFTHGVGRVAAKLIPEFRAAEDFSGLSLKLAAAFWLTIAFAGFQALLLASLAPVIAADLFDLRSSVTQEMETAIFIACLIGPAMTISQFMQSALRGLHRFGTVALVTVAASLLLNVGSVVIVLGRGNWVSVIAWTLAANVAAGIAFFSLARPSLPEFSLILKPDRTSLRGVSRFMLSLAAYQWITSILYLVERTIVARRYGPAAVAHFTVAQMLGTYLHALGFNVMLAFIPILNELLLNKGSLRRFYCLSTKIVLSITVLVWVGFYAEGHRFLSLWLGPEFAESSYSLMIAHGSAFALIALSLGGWVMAEALHRPVINTLSSATTAIVGIAAIFLLAPAVGLTGIAMGRAVGAAVVLPLILFIERLAFGRPLFAFWVTNFIHLSIAAAITLLVSVLFAKYHLAGWSYLVITVVVETGVFVGTLFGTGFLSLTEMRAFGGRGSSPAAG